MKKFLFATLFASATTILFAQTNVGIGTNTPINKLDVMGSIGTAFSTLTTGSLTLDENNSTILASPGTVINLPQASAATNRIYTIIYNGAAGGTALTINAYNGDNIDLAGVNSASLSVTEGTVILQSSGTAWAATSVSAGSGSGNYIQNQTSAAQSAGFEISGNGLFNGGSVAIGSATPGNNLLNVSGTAASSGTGSGIILDAQSSLNGTGGAVNVAAGNAGGTNNSGGNVLITPGTATGTGNAGNVAINTDPNPTPSAILDVYSTTQGLLPPRLTTVQRNLINVTSNPSAVQGLTIFNITTNCLETYIGTSWQPIGCGCTSAPGQPNTPTYTPTGSTICQGYNNFVFSIPEVAGASSYNWTLPNGASIVNGGGSSITVDFSNVAATGTQTVSVNAQNSCGTSGSATLGITVNAIPLIGSQPSSATICAQGGTGNTGDVVFSAGASGTNLLYQWQVNNGSGWNNLANGGVYTNVSASFTGTSSTTSNLTITGATTAYNGYQYQCVISGTCSPAITTIPVTLTVNPLPAVSNLTVTTCSGVLFSVTPVSSIAGTTYSWGNPSGTGFANGASASGQNNVSGTLTNSSSTALATAVYTVTPTSPTTPTNCAGSTFTVTVTIVPNIVLTAAPALLSTTSCYNTTQAAVTLGTTASGGAFTFNWANATNNTGAGPGNTGVTSIPSFTSTNTANTTTVTDAINVTPIYTVNTVSCPSTPVNSYFSYYVNPVPAINVSLTPTVCTGVGPAITLATQATPTADVTYAWPNGTLSGVTCSSGCTGATSAFSPVLAVTGTAVGTGTYSITPTFTFNTRACPGTASTATVTVVPSPALATAPTAALLTTCKGGTQAAETLGTTASGGSGSFTFNWSTATNNTGVGTAGMSGTSVTSIPSFTASDAANTTTVSDVISVTPVYTVNGHACTGTGVASYMTYYANPIPAINVSLTPTICNGGTTSITLATQATPTADNTYVWTAGTLNGVTCSSGCTGNSSAFNVTLANANTIEGTGVYSITPTFTFNTVGCAGSPSTATITVEPTITVPNAPLSTTVCTGVAANIALSSSATGSGTSTYAWNAGTFSGAGCVSGCTGTSSPFNADLTVTTSTAVGTGTYSVTPTYTLNSKACPGTPATVTVTVVPSPVMATAPAASTLTSCGAGATQAAITLATTATGGSGSFTFNWSTGTNNTGVGTAGMSGTGVTSIPSFTTLNAANTTTVTDAINVTPIYTVNGQSCTGTSASSYISYVVNPIPAINVSLTPTVCTGIGPAITLTTQATPTADVSYVWPTGTLSGVTCSSGCTGSTSSFSPVLAVTGTAVGTGTYSITPTFTFNGKACAGSASTATVTVVPTPVLTTAPVAASLTTCKGGTQAAETLATTATGGSGTFTFNWATSTNNTGVGTAGMSGTGVTSIPSFTALDAANTTTVTDAINVTPIYTVNSHSCTGTGVSSYMSYYVNPIPSITATLTPSVCSGTALSVALTSSASPAADNTYTWNAGTLTGVNCLSGCSGTSATFNPDLTVTSSTTNGSATYSITPTFTFQTVGCVGSASTASVTVAAPSALGTASNTGPIQFCSETGNWSNFPITVSGNVGTVEWYFGWSSGGWSGAWVAGANPGYSDFPPKICSSDGRADRVEWIATNAPCLATAASAAILIQNYSNYDPTSVTANAASVCSGGSTTINAIFTTTNDPPNNSSVDVDILGTVDFYTNNTCTGTPIGAVTAGCDVSTVSLAAPAITSTTTYYAQYTPPSALIGGNAACALGGCVAGPTVNVCSAITGAFGAQTGPTTVGANQASVPFSVAVGTVANATTYTWSALTNCTIVNSSGLNATVTFTGGTVGTAKTATFKVVASNCCSTTVTSTFTVTEGGTSSFTTAGASTWGGATYYVTSVNVTMAGAQGGCTNYGPGTVYAYSNLVAPTQSLGGKIVAAATITAGLTINTYVGAAGNNGTNTAGGAATTNGSTYGNGGKGGTSVATMWGLGGSGGASSEIQVGGTRVIVAGGGGGGGTSPYWGAGGGGEGGGNCTTSCGTATCGAANYDDCGNGSGNYNSSGCATEFGLCAPQAGTTGGAGGTYTVQTGTSDANGQAGNTGGTGWGGNGGLDYDGGYYGGGGGGGGGFNGGGGGMGEGGGGGSTNYQNGTGFTVSGTPTLTAGSNGNTSGTTAVAGYITITY